MEAANSLQGRLPGPASTGPDADDDGAPTLRYRSIFISDVHLAFRQEILLAAILIPAALLVPASPVERAVLIAAVLLVMIVELLNTGVEVAIDRISFEHHSLSKRAKDIGSAAVFIALVLLAAVWAAILVPRYL